MRLEVLCLAAVLVPFELAAQDTFEVGAKFVCQSAEGNPSVYAFVGLVEKNGDYSEGELWQDKPIYHLLVGTDEATPKIHAPLGRNLQRYCTEVAEIGFEPISTDLRRGYLEWRSSLTVGAWIYNASPADIYFDALDERDARN